MYGPVPSSEQIELKLPLPPAGDDVSVTRAEATAIGPRTPANLAFRSIALACLAQIIANKSAVMAGDPEGIHQMRVGLRRLRAAISLFSDIVADAKTRDIKTDLKWLTNELGPARELEVFLTRVMAPFTRQHMRLTGMKGLSNELADLRETAAVRAFEAVSSRRFHELTRNTAAWLEAGDWRTPQDRLARERAEAPIEVLARAQLKRLWKKIRKRERLLAKLDPEARHRLRIRTKKLRYATEFYKTVFPGKKNGKRRAAFLSALKDMQDCLGELNDIFVHEKLTAGLVKTSAVDARLAWRRSAAKLLTGQEAARFEPVLTEAKQAFHAFAKLEPYWK